MRRLRAVEEARIAAEIPAALRSGPLTATELATAVQSTPARVRRVLSEPEMLQRVHRFRNKMQGAALYRLAQRADRTEGIR